MPAESEPSPITAMIRWLRPDKSLTTAIPRAAEIDVAACAAPKGSNSLSLRLVKPESPPAVRSVWIR